MANRIVDFTSGVAMVVTDLHGDGEAYGRYRQRFRTLYAAGRVQRLILLGDLIHSYGPPHEDASLSMLRDVMSLQAELGADVVTMLLGNHEMPHLYGVALFKDEMAFTPRFEHALGARRDEVMAFLDSLPFYARTAAGVMLAHAGPAPEAARHAQLLAEFDHSAVLRDADALLEQVGSVSTLLRQYSAIYGEEYSEAASDLLAVRGPDDPRYLHLLRGVLIAHRDARFQTLWEALFTQNEAGVPEPTYVQIVREFLAAFSEGAPAPQRVIVSGHIVTPHGGAAIVTAEHLRLSSATHARPRTAGRYLLLDCAQPVNAVSSLVSQLGSVFDDHA